MALFKKKEAYLDLEKHLLKKEKRIQSYKNPANYKNDIDITTSQNLNDETQNTPSKSSTGFFGNFFGGSSKNESNDISSEDEKKKNRLIKRIINLTERLEEQDKELYQLKQRVEVLERKSNVGY